MRFIVVGGGRVGLALLEHALAEGEKVVLVDVDPARVQRARLRFGVIDALEGDATDERVLRKAGAPDVDALVVVTPDDPTNLMVCALAKRLGVRNVVARVSEEQAEPLFAEVGATPITNPSSLTAEHLYHAFEVPGVRSFMPIGEDAEVVTLVLGGRSELAGRSVREARFPRDSLLIAVNRHGRVIVPTGNLVLEHGDVLTMVVRKRTLDQVVERLAGRPVMRLAERLLGLVRRH